MPLRRGFSQPETGEQPGVFTGAMRGHGDQAWCRQRTKERRYVHHGRTDSDPPVPG